jgi:cytochrome P450 / NADPH-cytochrome P450 reductase
MTMAINPNIPEPKRRPLLENMLEIHQEAPLQSMIKLAERLGPIYRLTFPGRTFLVVSSHELTKEVCDESRFEKQVHGPLRHIRDFAGDGLFTAYQHEPNWGKAHRLLMPAFSPAAMKDYFEGMLDVANQMFIKWERFGPGQGINIPDSMTRLTLDTIALCGFAYRFNSFYQNELHPFVEAMVRALVEAGKRARRFPLQTRLMLLAQRQYDADALLMHDITKNVIAQRRSLSVEKAPKDLLGLMLNAKDSLTGEGLDDQNIRNQLVTFLIAGHETTSGLLSFAVHLLLQNPNVLERARAEVDAVLGDEEPRFEQMPKLSFLTQILQETLRLYPTAPIFGVKAKHNTKLGPYALTEGDSVLVLLPRLHRDKAVWKDPETFDPERFAPGAREQIPEKAWLPFGSGLRACIGRSFALQEATLVLAMMLQRFEFWDPYKYPLKIKETLTLKPENLQIRARVKKIITQRASVQEIEKPHKMVASGHNTPLLILYGSNTGASEAFARRIASDGISRGYLVEVAPLDDFADRLPKDRAVFIVTASYNGQPPDNARKFCSWLETAPSLTGVRYVVFGCGNRDWAGTYQAVPSLVDDHLQRAGAVALALRGEADARGDFFGDFERWYAPIWGAIDREFNVESLAPLSESLYQVERVPSSSLSLAQQNHLAVGRVMENRELVEMASPLSRSKRHLEIALPEGMTYTTGDYLAVLPENHPSLVARAANRFSLCLDDVVILRSTRGTSSALLPIDCPISVAALLGRYVELSSPATRKDLEALAAKSPCPPHHQHLAALASDELSYKAEILERRVSVLDMLEKYNSCEVSFAEFLGLLPAMRTRQYSISSSPLHQASQCSLTVAVLDTAAWSGTGQFRGTCSSYLARLEPGNKLAVAVRHPNHSFHPPVQNDTPMILVSAGTGIAPFRGFLQERTLRAEKPGATLFFFGCDHSEVDFLYRDELVALEERGLVEVFPAFFRQPEGEVSFVQHRVWQERERIYRSMKDGASFFVCGDGQKMAPAVRQTLAKIYQEAEGLGEKEGIARVNELERQGRYVADVFA